ncbi:hypothetical protein ERO13_1Z049379v2 [Gossypium hirsutum]|nr:hypothetical protein ERO13_1Z049379v2 [Gossypium hirsutum]
MVFQFGVFSSVFCVHTKCWAIGLKELLHTSISPPGSFSGSRLPTDGFIFGLSTVETWFSGRSPALSHVLYGFLPARTQHIMLCPNGANTAQEVWSKATHLFVAASMVRGFTVVTVGEIEADLNVRSMGILATFPNVAITGLIGGLVNL